VLWYRFKHYRSNSTFYNEINKVQNALWKSQPGRAMDDNDTDMMSNIIEIQIFGIFLYKVNHLRLDLIVTVKDLYIDRILLTRKETLKDYMHLTEVLELIP
jgi:hypothetical protein